jgi:sugar porter (SP) family MFS transporter
MYLTLACVVATLGGLLFGYDTGVINGSITFVQKHYQLSDAMKGWAASSALVACMIGAAFAGPMNDRFGRRKTLILSAALFLVSAIGSALPHSINEFIIYRVIGGLGVGAASMTSPMYIAEISPSRLRGRMVSINQLAIVSGMLLVYFVNFFIARHGDDAWNTLRGWRWMFGSESIPAMLLLVLAFFVPESPRWLTKQGRREEALDILARVDGDAYAKQEMDQIESVLQQEEGTISELFRPGMRIVLVIGIALAVLQQVTGINVFLYFGSDIFARLGGNSMDAALLQQIIVGATMLTFTVIAIWTVDKIGRKPLMMIGSVGMGISLLAMGLYGVMHSTGLWLLIFIVGYIASFSLSLGPVVWVILSEIFPTRLRGRAMAIATLCLWLANTVVSQTFPMMDGNDFLVEKFNHGFPFFIYAGFCSILFLFMWKVVPETKGRSLEEIEEYWLHR